MLLLASCSGGRDDLKHEIQGLSDECDDMARNAYELGYSAAQNGYDREYMKLELEKILSRHNSGKK